MRAFMRFIRGIYFSLFILFYKIAEGQWPAAWEFDLYKGVIWQSVVMLFLYVSVVNIFTVDLYRSALYNLLLIGGALTITSINWYVIVFSGAGIRFEKEFRKFSYVKKSAFYGTAVIIIIGAGGVLYQTMEAHLRAIGFE